MALKVWNITDGNEDFDWVIANGEVQANKFVTDIIFASKRLLNKQHSLYLDFLGEIKDVIPTSEKRVKELKKQMKKIARGKKLRRQK